MSLVLVFCSTCQEVTGCQCESQDNGRLGYTCRTCRSRWSEPVADSPSQRIAEYAKAHMREECGPEGAAWIQQADLDRVLHGRVSLETEAAFLALSDDDQLRVARFLGLIR